MTRKTPSRTKRELEKLRRRRNGDGDDSPSEVVVELGVVPPRSPDDDPVTEADRTVMEDFTVDLETGEVTRPKRPDPADLPTCPTCEMNPCHPTLDGDCVACAGMPRRDWPDYITDPDAPEDDE